MAAGKAGKKSRAKKSQGRKPPGKKPAPKKAANPGTQGKKRGKPGKERGTAGKGRLKREDKNEDSEKGGKAAKRKIKLFSFPRELPRAKILGEYWKLVRFEHAIMLAVAVIIAEIIVLGALPGLDLLFFLVLAVPVFSEMASFSLNDYLDVEADRINKAKGRPLVEGTIKKESAFSLSISCFAISIGASFFINFPAFIISVIYNLLAILYNTKLKDLPLAGNLFIATTMAIPFVFGAYAYSSAPTLPILAIALLGFVSGLAREIIKSAEDMEGDLKARGSKTLPILIGKEKSVAIAGFLFLLFVPLSIAPFMLGLPLSSVSGIFLFLADLPILYLAFSLFCRQGNEFLPKARKYSLAALFCGLLSLMLASLGF